MKKTLLCLMCLMAVLGVNASEYSDETIVLSNGETSSGANDVQYVELKEAGALANFINNNSEYQYFGTTSYRNKVVFSGPMNDVDINAIKTHATDGHWGNFATFDFTNVISQVKPILPFPNKLVIWPYVVEPTSADLSSQSSTIWNNGAFYAYYTDKNKNALNIMCAYSQSGGFSNAISELATMKGNVLDFDGLNFTYMIYDNGRVDYYPGFNSNFFSVMNTLPVKSVGLWGFNISDLGKNLTGLNDATQYIVMPCNVNDYNQGAEDFANFTYDSDVAVVAGFVNTDGPFGKGGSMGGANYTLTKDMSVSSMTLTYIKKAGTLQGGAAYLPGIMQTAEKMVICGDVNSDDLQAINHITSKYVDLSKANLANGVNIQDYSNTTTEHIALPNNSTKEDVDAIYANLNASGSLKSVVSFTTQALEATETTQAVPAKTLITYTAEQGLVYNLVYMIEEANTGNFASGVKNIIMSGHLNAYDICNSSATQSTTGQCVYSDGHIYMVGSEPEGTTQQTTGALNGCTLANVDFTHAIFDQPTTAELTAESCTGYFSADEKKNLVTDMNMVVCGIVPSETLLLPTDPSQKVIPAYFMSKSGNEGVSDLCIPYNFQYIMDYAFNACETHLKHIYTTPDPNAEGLIESEVDHGSYMYYDALHEEERELSSYTIGSKVKYIAVGAFDTGDTNAMGDVYVLAQTAPICEPNAFNSVKLMGNNGFKMSHPISRSNYVNAGWIATLHFPNALSDEVKKGYTDIDREYWYTDETGAVDGEGNLLTWPAHTEFMRSWNQANLGYTWNEWNTARELRDGWGTYGQVLVVGKYSDNFQSIPEIETITQETWVDDGKPYDVVTGNYETKTDQHADCSKCGFAGNIGWHQFLLAAPGYFYEVESTNYVETPWYSFCIPFDMTLQELNKYLGVPSTASTNKGAQPDVRTLRTVKRDTKKRHTDLIISKNLVKAAQDVETYGATDNPYREAAYVSISTQKDGADVYLKGGYPYFVKGWVPEGTDLSKYKNNLGQYVLAIAQFDTEDLGNVIVIDPSATEVADENVVRTQHYVKGMQNFIAMPYFNHTVDAFSTQDNVYYGQRTNLPTDIDEDVPYLYNFMGNFEAEDFKTTEDKKMPQYAYYMAGQKLDDVNSGKIYRYKTYNSAYLWKPYICMVGLNGKGSVYQKVISKVVTYHSAYANVVDDNKWGASEFDFTKTEEGGGNAGTFSIVFDDDDVPSGDVDNIINLNGQEMEVKVSAIYNLNGQYVGNTLNNLAKGVYVVNGKKIVVK